jgi:hypothetical protein
MKIKKNYNLRPIEVPHELKPSSECLVVNTGFIACEAKGKAKMGFVGSWPKFFFKPKFCKWVLG